MHAFIITGGNDQKRQKWIDGQLNQWAVGTFDRRELHPEEASIGISHIRQFQKSLITGTSAAIVWQAELLTVEAQNALLKTLEEPPRRARIILEASSIDTLLPTVLSRCLVTNLGVSDTFSESEHQAWLAAWATPGATLATHENRQEAQRWVICGIEALHQRLDAQSAKIIHRLLAARVQLAANVTPKLVIDLCILGQNTV